MSYVLLTNCIGKDRGWKVNQKTIEIWSNKVDDKAFASTSNYGAIYGGLVANCYVKEEEPDFTFEQVCDYVDELNTTPAGLALLEQVKEKFEASQYYIKILEKMEGMLKSMKEQSDEADSSTDMSADKKKAVTSDG